MPGDNKSEFMSSKHGVGFFNYLLFLLIRSHSSSSPWRQSVTLRVPSARHSPRSAPRRRWVLNVLRVHH